MIERYLALTAFILLFKGVQLLALNCCSLCVSPPDYPELFQTDSESFLTFGRPLVLRDVEVFDLELIPGVSDTLAFAIVAKREEILREATKLESKERYKALTTVHGIGGKKAKKLSNYLTVE